MISGMGRSSSAGRTRSPGRLLSEKQYAEPSLKGLYRSGISRGWRCVPHVRPAPYNRSWRRKQLVPRTWNGSVLVASRNSEAVQRGWETMSQRGSGAAGERPTAERHSSFTLGLTMYPLAFPLPKIYHEDSKIMIQSGHVRVTCTKCRFLPFCKMLQQ